MNDTGTNARKLVSLVTPFFNESETIAIYYEKVRQVFDNMPGMAFEVVCVEGGSRDDTLEKLVALARRDTRFRVIELARNFGKEAALTAGLSMARGDAVIPFDADLQDPPDVLPQLIAEWQRGAEVVLARRANRDSDSFLKRKTAAWFYRFHNMISDTALPENVGDFRLMDRVAVNALLSLPERQRFLKGLFAWVGFKTVAVDYTRSPRAAGRTKFSGWKLWNLAVEGITSFGTLPLRIWTYAGIAGVAASFLCALFIITRALLRGIDVPGHASLLVAILFMGSVQLISVGIIGEYVGRIYMETKRRPLYVIRRVHGDNGGNGDNHET